MRDPKNWYWIVGSAGWIVHSACMVAIAVAATRIALKR